MNWHGLFEPLAEFGFAEGSYAGKQATFYNQRLLHRRKAQNNQNLRWLLPAESVAPQKPK
jgi:hypothetical protein